ncbi:MAG: RluA family pseudouridine synthase [Acidimicrobiales bacterium]
MSADAGPGPTRPPIPTPPPVTAAIDVIVPASLAGSRLDAAAALLSGLSRRVVADMVAAGGVRLDGRAVALRSTPVRAGQRLEVDPPPATGTEPAPDPSVPFRVVYEDDDVVVVDKPAGVVVHHGAGHAGGTLVDGLLARFADLGDLAAAGVGDPLRPGIVHRLDKGTSGLLVVARSPRAYDSLVEQLRERSARRRYVALVVGAIPDEAATVDAPIGRSSRRRTTMAVTTRGRPARTTYEVTARYVDPVPCTLVAATLDTGRTHQVRVHMSAIGHPVVGDDRYGSGAGRPPALRAVMEPGRLFLHAAYLSIEHPAGGRATWESPLPDDLAAVLARLS